ncbi:MAG: class I SAM-dependent methyltransferase [Alphaproteobacteria bacterium]|nr:class I SAM-dependent methyltransferase [Alphaproteobacteria bacterium]
MFKKLTIFIFTLCYMQPIHAEDKSELAAETLKMPEPNVIGLVKTLNNMGYMVTKPDILIKRFIDYMGITKGRFLDVGAAFGEASIQALKAGASYGIANDIDEKQIKILENRIDPELRSKMAFMPGSFPDKVTWPKDSDHLDGILIARVLHFFDGPQIERALKISFEKLKPGGKIFILVSAPYVRQLEGLRKAMEEGKQKGEKWPGYTKNVWSFSPFMADIIQPEFHMLDFDVLSKAICETGFIMEYFEEIPLLEKSLEKVNSANGIEALAFIGRKPLNGM